MQILIASSLLAALFVAFLLTAQGYANTVDCLAFILHRHALRIRAVHAKRTVTVSKRWSREFQKATLEEIEARG